MLRAGPPGFTVTDADGSRAASLLGAVMRHVFVVLLLLGK
jgi:hypothetical protein